MFSEPILKYLLIPLVAFTVTYVLTPWVAKFARVIGMEDVPSSRRVHSHTVPRGGGLAIIVGFNLACVALFFVTWGNPNGYLNINWWWRFALIALPLLIAGVQDDLGFISMPVKLCWQIAAALIAFQLGVRMEGLLGFHLPVVLDFVATVLWFLIVINAFNLIDGIDGLATGLACIASLGLAGSLLLRRAPGDALVIIALFFSCLAFLRFNFHPARIFLGDTGSMFVGGAIATIALSTGSASTVAISIAVPLLAVGIPLFDTMLAVWRRGVRSSMGVGDGVLRPDIDHIHHRMLREGRSQKLIAVLLYGAAIGFVVIGLVSQVFASFSLGIYLLAFLAGSYAVMRHVARVELWSSTQAILQGLRRPRRKTVSVILYPVLDTMLLGGALFLSIMLGEQWLKFEIVKERWVSLFPIWVGVPFLLMFIGRTYRRVWSRARLSEYVVLSVVMAGGFLAAGALSNIIYAFDLRQVLHFIAVMGMFALPGIIGMRLFFRVVQDFAPVVSRRPVGEKNKCSNILIYPADFESLLFLKARSLELVPSSETRCVIGLLDDDSNLYGRYVHGFEVLGGLTKIDSIIEKYGVTEIILTRGLDEEQMKTFMSIAAKSGVNLFEWQTKLTSVSLDGNKKSLNLRLVND